MCTEAPSGAPVTASEASSPGTISVSARASVVGGGGRMDVSGRSACWEVPSHALLTGCTHPAPTRNPSHPSVRIPPPLSSMSYRCEAQRRNDVLPRLRVPLDTRGREMSDAVLGCVVAAQCVFARVVSKGVPKETASTTPATEETGSTPSTTPESSTPVTDPWKEEEKRGGFPEVGTGTSLEAGEADRIYGQTVYAKHSYRVVDGRIYDRGAEIRLKGINWFGLDTPDLALHGLWSGYSRQDYLERIVDLQFNAIRLPLAPESIEDGNEVAPWAYEAGAATGRQHLERFLAEARDLGLYVLLDVHTCSADAGSRVGDPFECEGYDQTRWLNNLASLAELAGCERGRIDLFNSHMRSHGHNGGSWSPPVQARTSNKPQHFGLCRGRRWCVVCRVPTTGRVFASGRHPVTGPLGGSRTAACGPSVAWHGYFDAELPRQSSWSGNAVLAISWMAGLRWWSASLDAPGGGERGVDDVR